jgi:hypothetical protein
MVINKIGELRKNYLDRICEEILAKKKDTVNIADIGSKASKNISNKLAVLIGGARCSHPPTGQKAGMLFAEITKDFLEKAFLLLQEVRPGDWGFMVETPITGFDQYCHLHSLKQLAKEDRDVAILLGIDYLVKPDIVICRYPIAESELVHAAEENVLNNFENIAQYTPLRKKNSEIPILHASISCKWTMRSDRSQNTRTEALNLIRNRKGNTPHVTAITAEPLPTRIASLALGMGDMDCLYHMALPELKEAIKTSNNEDQIEMLANLIDGRRLRDISDLVFDLAI